MLAQARLMMLHLTTMILQTSAFKVTPCCSIKQSVTVAGSYVLQLVNFARLTTFETESIAKIKGFY